jgi:hypothetical protein
VSELTRLAWQALVTDVVDTSSSNPCLLTLANRAPQRIASGTLMAATTVSTLSAAGQPVVNVTSVAGIRSGQLVWLGGASPETVVVQSVGTTSFTATANLASDHVGASLVSTLPTIVTQEEPRLPIGSADAYWRIVIGPTHEHPDSQVAQRSPVRLYEALMFVKVYDASASRKVAEDVQVRLDWLLNLGEEGANGNAAPLLGSSTTIWISSLKLVSGPEPRFEPTTQVTQFPQMFKVEFQRVFV